MDLIEAIPLRIAMKQTSIGYQTDIMLASFDGEIVDRPHHIVIRTPANPTFWWGNFVLFDCPPSDGDTDKWEMIFAAELGDLPGIKHVNLAWLSAGGATGVVSPFLDRGYTLTRNIFFVLRGKMLLKDKPPDVEIRAISSDAEWEMALRNQHRCLEGANDTPAFRGFQSLQMIRYRNMTLANFGYWLGAFIDGELVGDMGIFGKSGLARCQAVAVDPNYRRRGIGGAMVRSACILAQDSLRAETVVIMTGEDNPARRIYERIGFVPIEQASSVARSERD